MGEEFLTIFTSGRLQSRESQHYHSSDLILKVALNVLHPERKLICLDHNHEVYFTDFRIVAPLVHPSYLI